MNRCYIFCHGFGFDSLYWMNLVPFFLSQTCIFLDLGYFGKRSPPLKIPRDAQLIGIGHSLGFIKLTKLGIHFAGLIGLNGFIDFINFKANENSQRSIELRKMKQAYDLNPQSTLLNFYHRAGFENYSHANISTLDVPTLAQEFEVLNQKLDFLLDCPTLVIGTINDPIVPHHIIRYNFSQTHVSIKILNEGMHGLGYFKPGLIYFMIMNFLDEYVKN